MYGLLFTLTLLGQTQPTTTPETLGATEILQCQVQKILTGPQAGQYRILAVLDKPTDTPSRTIQQTSLVFLDDDDVSEPQGERINGETLGPLETVNLAGYGDCEARKILRGPDTDPQREVGKYRIIRQLIPPAPPGDPYGFMAWLNSTRASYGLGAVGYDENLSSWAAMNNSQQLARGLGHYIMGPARRQNAAMGGGFPGNMWMNSGGHRAALLDPTISWFGIAAAGAYWTFNAY